MEAAWDFIYFILIAPFVWMIDEPFYLLQVVLEGIMAGIMYSLVALGFVLIYKASGVFNFAQGMFVVLAALALIVIQQFAPEIQLGLSLALIAAAIALGYFKQSLDSTNLLVIIVVGGGGVVLSYFLFPIGMAIFLAIGFMILLAMATERVVLRPLINQEEIILFMATIGLFFFLEGFGETIFGGSLRVVPREALGLPSGAITIFGGEIRLQKIDMTAAVVAAIMVGGLALLFRYTTVGRALRAVADDHQAALSVGIPLNTMWVIVWSVAGVVALGAGLMWGASSGSVSFSLVVIALKALPVLILGGFTSIPGVIVGGFIIGIGEKVFEIFWDNVFPGTTEEWFAYVLALVVLLFRPQGLFGEKIIERV